MSTLTLQSDVTAREVDRAVRVIRIAPESSPAQIALYTRALTEFRSGRGITAPVTNADLAAAVGLRGSAMASQRNLASSWLDILRADLARVTHPARGGEGETR